MRSVGIVVIGLACMMLVGCAQLDTLLNPEPTTEGGSRVASKLEGLPKPDPAKVKTVTVYQFKNKSGWVHGLTMGQGMREQLITALIRSGHFKVVERGELGDIQTEKALARSGQATGDAAKTKIMGAQLIFAGAITEMDQTGGGSLGGSRFGTGVRVSMSKATVAIDMRVIDVGTSQVLDSIPVRKETKKTGVSAHSWGLSGGVKVTGALDLAVREVIELAVYELVQKHGAF